MRVKCNLLDINPTNLMQIIHCVDVDKGQSQILALSSKAENQRKSAFVVLALVDDEIIESGNVLEVIVFAGDGNQHNFFTGVDLQNVNHSNYEAMQEKFNKIIKKLTADQDDKLELVLEPITINGKLNFRVVDSVLK